MRGAVARLLATDPRLEVVSQASDGRIEHYDVLGFVVVGAMGSVLLFLYPIHLAVLAKVQALPPAAGANASS